MDVLGDHFKFPPGFLAYRLPNTLSVIGSPGREDLLSNLAPNRSLIPRIKCEMSSRTNKLGRGVCSTFTYEAGPVADKPEQALSCEVREVIMRKLVPHRPVMGNYGWPELFSRLTGYKQCTVAGVCSIPTLELTGDYFGRSRIWESK